MALIKCSECGKEFSDKAKACPNCACPIEEIKNEEVLEKSVINDFSKGMVIANDDKDKKVIMWIAIACVSLIALMGIIFLFRRDDKQTQSNERDFSVLQVRVIVDSINIRSENNVESNILGTVYKDEIYTVLSIDYKSPYHFYEIETRDGTRGFIAGVSQGVSYVEELQPDDYMEPEIEKNNNETITNTSTNTNNNAKNNIIKNTTKTQNNTSTNTNATKPQSNTNQNTNSSTNTNTSTNTQTLKITSISGKGSVFKNSFNECRVDNFNATIKKISLENKYQVDYTLTMTKIKNYYGNTSCEVKIAVYDSDNIQVGYRTEFISVDEGETGRSSFLIYVDKSGYNYSIKLLPVM